MAASTFWARLVHGNKRLQLDLEPYMLSQSFQPPAVSRSVNYATGGGREKGGGKRINEKYGDHAWTFNLRIFGDTEAEVNGYVHRLGAFLQNAGDEQYPLQFEYYPYSATGCIPLWGQGVYRYTIKEAILTTISPWLLRDGFAIVSVACRIGPMVDGQRQRVALASGGIYEDTIKTPNGESRGVQVCTAGTNIFTNPIFSHDTWNTGWTASADLIATGITNGEYVLFGDTCAKIQNNGGTAGTAQYTTTMTTGAATYVISAYVKLLDERAPGTADMQLWCRGTALGAFNTISVGDNWYRIWDTAACPSAAGTAGIKLMNPGAACYVDGFQMEVPYSIGTAPTPLMHGDALGCAWSSTRGASTTVRTVGALKLPVSAEVVNSANSSIRMIVKWHINTDDILGTTALFDAHDGTSVSGMFLSYSPSANMLTMNYGTGGYISLPYDYNSGDTDVIYLCWGKTADGSNQVALYSNESGTVTSTIDLATWANNMFIGSFYNNTGSLLASILDFTIFDRYLTAAEVAADYAQVSAHVNGGDGLGQALSRIPYLWTKDGDGIVDSYNDSTHDDFAVVHGIPGDLPANAVFDMRATFAGTADGGLLMANQTYKDYLDETNLYNGTDVAQAVGTAAVTFPSGGTVVSLTRQLDAYRGEKAYILAAVTDAGTTDCRGRMVISYDTAANAYYSDFVTMDTVADGTARWYLFGPMIIPDTMPSKYDWMSKFGELNINFDLLRTTGTGTVTVGQFRVVPGEFLYAPVEGLTTNHGIVIDENRAYSYNSSTSKEDGIATLYGDEIALYPGVYNHLITVPMAVGRSVNVADTVTFNRLYVTPRYSLL